MPRSGTTWIGKIFDSHTDTLYRHEPDSWSRIGAIPLLPRQQDAERFAAEFGKYLPTIVSMNAPKVSGKTPLFAKRYQSGLQFKLQKAGVLMAKFGGRLSSGFPVYGGPTKLTGDSRLVWKSIESLGRLGVFMKLLPDARAIHIIRHPCGYVSSVLRGEQRSRFEDNSGASDDYGIFHLLLDTRFARQQSLDLEYLAGLDTVERLAWRWLLFNEKALDDCVGNDRVTRVLYDDLCRDPLGVARKMFDFCGLDWSPQTQAFLGASTSRNDGAYYSVFKDPAAAALRWQSELDAGQQEKILRIAALGRCGRAFAAHESTAGVAGAAAGSGQSA
jgi:hypothetical protein